MTEKTWKERAEGFMYSIQTIPDKLISTNTADVVSYPIYVGLNGEGGTLFTHTGAYGSPMGVVVPADGTYNQSTVTNLDATHAPNSRYEYAQLTFSAGGNSIFTKVFIRNYTLSGHVDIDKVIAYTIILRPDGTSVTKSYSIPYPLDVNIGNFKLALVESNNGHPSIAISEPISGGSTWRQVRILLNPNDGSYVVNRLGSMQHYVESFYGTSYAIAEENGGIVAALRDPDTNGLLASATYPATGFSLMAPVKFGLVKVKPWNVDSETTHGKKHAIVRVNVNIAVVFIVGFNSNDVLIFDARVMNFNILTMGDLFAVDSSNNMYFSGSNNIRKVSSDGVLLWESDYTMTVRLSAFFENQGKIFISRNGNTDTDSVRCDYMDTTTGEVVWAFKKRITDWLEDDEYVKIEWGKDHTGNIAVEGSGYMVDGVGGDAEVLLVSYGQDRTTGGNWTVPNVGLHKMLFAKHKLNITYVNEKGEDIRNIKATYKVDDEIIQMPHYYDDPFQLDISIKMIGYDFENGDGVFLVQDTNELIITLIKVPRKIIYVSTPQDLVDIREVNWAQYIQINDIDMTDIEYTTALYGEDFDEYFYGNYDGGGFEISNLTILPNPENDGYTGLVGRAAMSMFKNMNFIDCVAMAEDADSVAILVGEYDTYYIPKYFIKDEDDTSDEIFEDVVTGIVNCAFTRCGAYVGNYGNAGIVSAYMDVRYPSMDSQVKFEFNNITVLEGIVTTYGYEVGGIAGILRVRCADRAGGDVAHYHDFYCDVELQHISSADDAGAFFGELGAQNVTLLLDRLESDIKISDGRYYSFGSFGELGIDGAAVHISNLAARFILDEVEMDAIGGIVGNLDMSEDRNIYPELTLTNGYVSIIGNLENIDDVDAVAGDIYMRQQSAPVLESVYHDNVVNILPNLYDSVPKTTIEMYKRKTFEDWDFNNVWYIIEGQIYPTMRKPKGRTRTKCNRIPLSGLIRR